MFIAPWYAPILLATRPGTAVRGVFRTSWPAGSCWALSWVSFAVLGFAWGGLAIENIHP